MRGERSGRERLDFVAVVVQRRPLTLDAQHALEQPALLLMLDGGLAGDRRGASAAVAVLALRAPAAFLEEKAVLYP